MFQVQVRRGLADLELFYSVFLQVYNRMYLGRFTRSLISKYSSLFAAYLEVSHHLQAHLHNLLRDTVMENPKITFNFRTKYGFAFGKWAFQLFSDHNTVTHICILMPGHIFNDMVSPVSTRVILKIGT